MRDQPAGWTRRLVVVGLLGAACLVAYAVRTDLVILARPLIRPLVVRLLTLPGAWEPDLSPGAQAQAEAIHAWLGPQTETIDALRRRINSSRTASQLRSDLGAIVGIYTSCSGPQRVVSETLLYSNDAYSLRRLRIAVCGGELQIAALFASPVGRTNSPLVVALHGTAAGPEVLFDGWSDGDPADQFDIADYHNSLGSVLSRSGFAVFAPQLITERRALPVVGFNGKRNELHMRLLALGYTLTGIELTTTIAALTALSASPQFDFDRTNVGAYGVSLGGATAYLLAALDERIGATVISQWIEDRDEKFFGDIRSANWRFPSGANAFFQGFSRQFSDTEVLELILPRRVFVEAGKQDTQRTAAAIRTFSVWRERFPEAAAAGHICLEVGPGGHVAQVDRAITWLQGSLTAASGHGTLCQTGSERDLP